MILCVNDQKTGHTHLACGRLGRKNLQNLQNLRPWYQIVILLGKL